MEYNALLKTSFSVDLITFFSLLCSGGSREDGDRDGNEPKNKEHGTDDAGERITLQADRDKSPVHL